MALLFVTVTLLCYFLAGREWILALCTLPFCVAAMVSFFRYHQRIGREMAEYLEAVRYRDFTRRYSWKDAPPELKPLRKGFNELNEAFKTISRERETQFQYLQTILEMVDTGILSFESDTGEVLWINEAIKRLVNIPYLKNVAQLEARNPPLAASLRELSGAENKVISLKQENNQVRVLMTATAFQTGGRTYKLVAFQNINDALDETEALAWQKLLSVMTHELMNSVAPIASLADTLKKRLHQADGLPDKADLLADLEVGMSTIKRRSEGLQKFADTYRNLSRITHLNVTRMLARDLFESIYQLMEPTLAQKGIDLEVVLEETGISLEADHSLVEQVLINLIVNAVDAVREQDNPCITLSAGHENGRTFLKVTDNGRGIPEAVRDRIFIPFFSTRKNGNGIGLSLCKQIMLLHHGTITLHTADSKGTSFRLVF